MSNATGTHHFVPDPRNAEVLIDVNGEHVPRPQASVSVFDSGFMLGDGVWEGIRVHSGRLAFLDRHLDRLYRGRQGDRDGHRPEPRRAGEEALCDCSTRTGWMARASISG